MIQQVEDIRTGGQDYPVAQTCPVDPAAHAALRAFWQAQPRRDHARHANRPTGRRINLTAGQLKAAYDRRMAGKATAAIATDFGIATMTLVLRLREAGYKLPGRHFRLSSKENRE